MPGMSPDRCLHVCMLGDPGAGHSAFLRCYRGAEGGPEALIESMVAEVELEGEPWRVRFTDNMGNTKYETLRAAALGSAHVILVCFSVDSPGGLVSASERWVPLLRAAGTEAPFFLVGLRGDNREAPDRPLCADAEECETAARLAGAVGYLESSAVHPASVRRAVDEALAAAKEFYALQWQLTPDPAYATPQRLATAAPCGEGAAEPAWLAHERLNVTDDPRAADAEAVKQSLSMLGRTPSRQHACLKCDLSGRAITSIDALRPFVHLQVVNVARNQLRTLEPLGALRCLLHLNASHNCLIRTQCFAAPDTLETADLSYNMIGEVGDWGVHKYLRELNLRGNFISEVGCGLRQNKELRMLDLSENNLAAIDHLDGLGLKTLHLAQNQLSSVEGVGGLPKLQVLSVQHNMITSIAALRSEDVPRLRTLCIADNRISHIAEVAGLESFPFLCDLLLAPNPIVELPYYRSQVLHRLPHLRSLDGEQVAGDAKVKSDIIYGVDVDARRAMFQELLPQENFVDRRLVTEEGIAEMELGQLGQQGDAGPYGALAAGGPGRCGARTRMQDCKFRQMVAMARAGGEPAGVSDFTDFPAPFASIAVSDPDMPAILEAVLEGGVERLVLGPADLGIAGVRQVLAALAQPAGALRFVDLTGCIVVGKMGRELIDTFPIQRGCSLEAAECGLQAVQESVLRNDTKEAAAARERAADERRRTARLVEEYVAKQEALEDYAAERRDRAEGPPPPPPPLCHPLQWRPGISGDAEEALKACRTAHPKGLGTGGSFRRPDGRQVALSSAALAALAQQRDSMLEEWGCVIEREEAPLEGEGEAIADRPGGAPLGLGGRELPPAFAAAFAPVLESTHLLAFMLWAGVEPDAELTAEIRRQAEEWEAAWRQREARCHGLGEKSRSMYDASTSCSDIASGQLIAHFTYLCSSGALPADCAPKPHAHFGLKRIGEGKPRPAPKFGQDLHEALAAGKVSVQASGTGFGAGSLALRIQNETDESFEVAIRKGTIFQHIDWQHRQNLLVSMDYVVMVPEGGFVDKALTAYCMNSSCACSCGNPMSLTEFFLDEPKVLDSQGHVWDHFEACFSKQ